MVPLWFVLLPGRRGPRLPRDRFTCPGRAFAFRVITFKVTLSLLGLSALEVKHSLFFFVLFSLFGIEGLLGVSAVMTCRNAITKQWNWMLTELNHRERQQRIHTNASDSQIMTWRVLLEDDRTPRPSSPRYPEMCSSVTPRSIDGSSRPRCRLLQTEEERRHGPLPCPPSAPHIVLFLLSSLCFLGSIFFHLFLIFTCSFSVCCSIVSPTCDITFGNMNSESVFLSSFFRFFFLRLLSIPFFSSSSLLSLFLSSSLQRRTLTLEKPQINLHVL